MTTVNDHNNSRQRYDNQRAKLRDGSDDLADDDADAILAFLDELDVSGQNSVNTLVNKATVLRKTGERAETPLMDMDYDDVQSLLVAFKRGTHPDVKDGGFSDEYHRNIRTHLRQFFEHHGREWAEDIHVGATTGGKVTAEHILTKDEITALFDAAQRPREKALLGVLLATGQRIGAVASLRIGDVDLSGRTGTIHLNDDAIGLKGASGPRPLIWATEYVKNWLDVHPKRDDPDAPLFCAVKSGQMGGRDGRSVEWEVGDAMSTHHYSRRLKRVAEDAAVDREKVNPHNFRHTAVTRMARDGLSEQKIKWMVGWGEDSSQFRRYSHVTDDQMMNDILAEYDLAEPETGIGTPDLSECPRCNAALGGPVDAEFCPGCGLALSQTAAASVDDARDDAMTDLADPETTDDQRETVKHLIDAIGNNPDLAAAVTDAARDAETTDD